MGEVEGEDAVMGLKEGGVDSEVGGGATEGLDIDAPLLQGGKEVVSEGS